MRMQYPSTKSTGAKVSDPCVKNKYPTPINIIPKPMSIQFFSFSLRE